MTVSCDLTLQICLIIALSFHYRHWRFGFVNGQVSLAWSIVLRSQELYTQPRVWKERWWEERTGSSSLNFFQVVFTRVVIASLQPPLLRACLLGSKRNLPPSTCQVRLGLPSVVCCQRGTQFPGTVYICNRVLCQALELTAFLLHHAVATHSSATDGVWKLAQICRMSMPIPQIMLQLLSVLSPPLLLSKSRAS